MAQELNFHVDQGADWSYDLTLWHDCDRKLPLALNTAEYAALTVRLHKGSEDALFTLSTMNGGIKFMDTNAGDIRILIKDTISSALEIRGTCLRCWYDLELHMQAGAQVYRLCEGFIIFDKEITRDESPGKS